MFRLFQHHVSMATLAELLADSLTSFLAILLGIATFSHLRGGAGFALNTPEALWGAVGFALMVPLNCGLFGVYRDGAERKTQKDKLVRVLLACVFAIAIGFLVADHTIPDLPGSSGLLILAAIYLLGGLALVRGVLMGSVRTSLSEQRILIVGTGKEARAVAADLRNRRLRSHTVIGFYPAGEQDLAPHISKRFTVFSRSHSLVDIIHRHQIDQIIVAVKEQRGGNVPMDQLLTARIQGIPVMDLAAFYECTTGEVPVDSLKASWLVYGNGFAQGPVRRAIKRAFDIVSSSILLVMASPVMLLTAIAIKLESEGPVIYRQERVGLGGKIFMCLKFRSMRTDAEKDGVAVWAKKNDSRVTRVGAFIRKTRIDELPQIISVLKGEMSMVGPRPERPSFVDQLKQKIPYYDIRHSVSQV